MFNKVFFKKAYRYVRRKVEAKLGGLFHRLDDTLEAMALRPFELHLELTNICNANCVFCAYQFQQRPTGIMSDEVFKKAVADYVGIKGGSVGLTPIVGDALVDPKFLERVRYLRSFPEIDRILLTTNAILLDRFVAREVLTSGISTINLSTAGFQKDSYGRVYRSPAYERMHKNVLELVKTNAELGNPVYITLCIRSDRPLEQVMRDPDFAPILEYKPALDFTYRFSNLSGRIKPGMLPPGMTLKQGELIPRREPCGYTYTMLYVQHDGSVMACACVVSMDAEPHLKVGHIMENSLQEIYQGEPLRKLREQFKPGGNLNPVCTGCDMYCGLEVYRLKEGRVRAELNRRRAAGELVKRPDRPNAPFAGG